MEIRLILHCIFIKIEEVPGSLRELPGVGYEKKLAHPASVNFLTRTYNRNIRYSYKSIPAMEQIIRAQFS